GAPESTPPPAPIEPTVTPSDNPAPAGTSTPTPEPIEPSPTAPAEPTDVALPEASATATSAPADPTATLPPPGGTLRVEQWGYSQAEAYAEVSWGFLISNQDRTNAMFDTAYVLTFLDETGETVKVDEGYIDVLLPGAEIGVGGSTFLAEGAIARSMRVDVRPGRLEPLSIAPEIAVDDVAYFERSQFPIATGAVSTDFDLPLLDLRVYAVGFGRDGEIIGGGNTYLPFVQPDDPVGVEVSISSVGQPARIELYPVITASTIHADTLAREGNEPAEVSVIDQGWSVVAGSGEIGWGFVLQNERDDLAAEPVLYQVTAWSTDGAVLATNASYLAVLLPGEDLGVGGSFFAPEGEKPARVDVQALGRSVTTLLAEAGDLATTDVRYVPDSFTPRVAGQVVNGLDVDLNSVAVFAIAYDADDVIIGGGLAYVDVVPAQSEAPVEVAVAVGSEPKRVVLYATVSSASQLP
ncbi:MAG: hypothetical protein M9890_13450, partial [Thermomicrobiales bacterium]|nr:hypothetical protein [Thermomicrobiales bacterium]